MSYDSVAATYEEVAVRGFEAMARDLLTAVGIGRGASILDVGTGTGLTAGLARTAVGESGTVVGVDPSTGMLHLARTRRGIAAVAAMVPGLPFPDGSFDAVVANLVISHLPDLAAGLGDMVRVLRPGGRLGATAWGPELAHPGDQGSDADGVVASVREARGLAVKPPVEPVPWEELLQSGPELCEALTRAGLGQVEVRDHICHWSFSIAEYLSGWGSLGRYLRWQVGEQPWRMFVDDAAGKLQERFGDTIVSVKQVWVATGTARRVGKAVRGAEGDAQNRHSVVESSTARDSRRG